MKVFSVSLLVMTLTLASGCQPNWTRLDGGSADEAGLQTAKKTCRVEKKLAALERAREGRDDDITKSSSNDSKMLIKDDFAAVERQVYREIDICMHREGYKR